MTVQGIVERADDAIHVCDGTDFADLTGSDDACLEAHVAVFGALGLEKVHAVRRGGDGQAAHVVQTAGLAADGFQLFVELDGVTLQRRHVGVRVEGMEATGGVPCGSGGEFRSLDQHHVLPAELGEVVQHAAADDAAANDGHLHMGFHLSVPSFILAANPA